MTVKAPREEFSDFSGFAIDSQNVPQKPGDSSFVGGTYSGKSGMDLIRVAGRPLRHASTFLVVFFFWGLYLEIQDPIGNDFLIFQGPEYLGGSIDLVQAWRAQHFSRARPQPPLHGPNVTVFMRLLVHTVKYHVAVHKAGMKLTWVAPFVCWLSTSEPPPLLSWGPAVPKGTPKEAQASASASEQLMDCKNKMFLGK